MDCHFSVWGILAFLSLALVVSLTLNISHCVKKRQGCASATCLMHAILWLGNGSTFTIPFTQGKLHLCCTCRGGKANKGDFNKAKFSSAAKMHYDYEENNPSYDGYPTEDYPVYGNLNQDILEECCYEQMKSQPQRPVNQLQVESANQMCYASLDHSAKGKCRKPRRKKDPSLEKDEEERSSNPMVASKVSIYLNSEQLAAENTAKAEAIHDDPIRLMGLIHNTNRKN